MAIKKSELYSSLWTACDELRGGIEPAAYKDYVLVLLFIKYVSDKYANKHYPEIKIPKGATFADLVKLKGKTDIGDQINKKILGPLAEANHLGNLPDFNDSERLGSGKEMVDRLTKLVAVFEGKELDFSRNRADGDDILGDAYEYLMRHFASESGKAKGSFYTPAEVSRIMALVLGIAEAKTTGKTTVYDPTCGSGSLLLKVGDAAKAKVTLYGQELDVSTAALAKMNLVMHGYPTVELFQGNTLSDPQFMAQGSLKTFDYAVANPPFSDKRWSNGIIPQDDPWERFEPYGIPPATKGDYAYMLHVIRSLKPNGKAAIILPHGVLFRGNVEAAIRQNLIERGYIKGIIGLPANLFYGTGIPACIVVLDKASARQRKGIFMIDASDGFMKDGPKNRLRDRDVHLIVDTFNQGEDIKGFARYVPMEEIAAQCYNLNLPRHIESNKAEDIQDIDAHLNGGIPDQDIEALANYWQVFPKIRGALFKPDRAGCQTLLMPLQEVNPFISEHPDFNSFQKKAAAHFEKWRKQVIPGLEGLKAGIKPKDKIVKLSEGLLAHYQRRPLIDAYDIYQLIMDYWEETLSDDFYLIAAEGWKAAPEPVMEVIKSGKLKGGKKETGWTCDLLPKELLVARHFADEQSELDELNAQLEAMEYELAGMEEMNAGEDGAFDNFHKVNKATVTEQIRKLMSNYSAPKLKLNKLLDMASNELREGRFDEEIAAELEVLQDWLTNFEEIAMLKRAIKEKDAALNTMAREKYPSLSKAEIKDIVIHDKWLTDLDTMITEANQAILQRLGRRLKELAERYETPLPQLQNETGILARKVDGHLKTMGFSWK